MRRLIDSATAQCGVQCALPNASHERTASVDANQAQDIAERDQLWASLRALRAEIDRLSAGDFDGSERQRQILALLARIVAAELDYRARAAPAD